MTFGGASPTMQGASSKDVGRGERWHSRVRDSEADRDVDVGGSGSEIEALHSSAMCRGQGSERDKLAASSLETRLDGVGEDGKAGSRYMHMSFCFGPSLLA